MTGVVVEASTAPAWCFPDESSEYADAVLVALEGKTILAPSIWPLEIANAMLVGERTKRLRQPEIQRFTALLERLSPATSYHSHANTASPCMARRVWSYRYDVKRHWAREGRTGAAASR